MVINQRGSQQDKTMLSYVERLINHEQGHLARDQVEGLLKKMGGQVLPNNRRQLTWLTGCPNPAGLGSPATQLMQTISHLLRL
jgi:hypothetical protein